MKVLNVALSSDFLSRFFGEMLKIYKILIC